MSTVNREPPHNYEAEQALLGALLANNDVWYRCSDFLRPDHFADALHGRIFEAIGKLIGRGQIANPVTLKNLFDQDGALEEIGGAQYLVQLASAIVTVINAEDYGRAVTDLYIRRELMGAAEELSTTAATYDPDLTPLQIITSFEGRFYDIGMRAGGKAVSRASPAREYLYAALQQAEAAFRQGDVVGGIKTGLPDLDDIIGALMPGKSILLAARSSMGKSALALCIGDHAARNGHRVGFFSLEMPKEEVGLRQLSMATGISGHLALRGKQTEMEMDQLVQAGRDMDQLPIWIDDTAPLTIADLSARARQQKRRHGLDLLIIDYLQLVRPSRARDNKVAEVTEVSAGIKELARSLDIPVLTLSQLNREVEKREDKRPQLSDLRESGAIEQDADIVMMLFREEYYHERSKPKDKSKTIDWEARLQEIAGKAEIDIAKHRGGPIGHANLHFDKATTKFTTWHREAPE